MGSKVEYLWLEGNPLCEVLEPNVYIKKILMKFPRLLELVSNKLACKVGLMSILLHVITKHVDLLYISTACSVLSLAC